MELRTIERFPDYAFAADGSVYSYIKKSPLKLKPIKMGKYRGLQLRARNGAQEKQYLHRLIAEAFHGPCPAGMQCRHLNGDRNDNRAQNLAWGTAIENNADKIAHGTNLSGCKNPMAKLDWETVRAMRSHRADTGDSYRIIGEIFGVSTMTAYRAVTAQNWRQS